MAKSYPYPSDTLAKALRAEGFEVTCAWEVKADKQAKGVAWLTCYVVRGTPERPAFMAVIVQTFMDEARASAAWEAWVPAYEGVEIAPTVQAVIDRATRKPTAA